MSENCDVIVFFLIYGQFTAIRKPNSGSMSIKLIFSLIVIFYPTEPENRTKKSLTQLLYYCFDYRYCFYQKILIFLRKKCILVRKGIFSETKYGFVLSYQISRFQRNSSQNQHLVRITPPPPPSNVKRTHKKLTLIRFYLQSIKKNCPIIFLKRLPIICF